jgi:hypothetical protein
MPEGDHLPVQVEHACGQTLVERGFISHVQRRHDPSLDSPRRHRDCLKETLRFWRATRHPREDSV